MLWESRGRKVITFLDVKGNLICFQSCEFFSLWFSGFQIPKRGSESVPGKTNHGEFWTEMHPRSGSRFPVGCYSGSNMEPDCLGSSVWLSYSLRRDLVCTWPDKLGGICQSCSTAVSLDSLIASLITVWHFCYSVELSHTPCSAGLWFDKTNPGVSLQFCLDPSDDRYRAWKDP